MPNNHYQIILPNGGAFEVHSVTALSALTSLMNKYPEMDFQSGFAIKNCDDVNEIFWHWTDEPEETNNYKELLDQAFECLLRISNRTDDANAQEMIAIIENETTDIPMPRTNKHSTGERILLAKHLWQMLGDIPTDSMDRIEERFLMFEPYTSRYDIWHWFENVFDIRVHDLMYRRI